MHGPRVVACFCALAIASRVSAQRGTVPDGAVPDGKPDSSCPGSGSCTINADAEIFQWHPNGFPRIVARVTVYHRLVDGKQFDSSTTVQSVEPFTLPPELATLRDVTTVADTTYEAGPGTVLGWPSTYALIAPKLTATYTTVATDGLNGSSCQQTTLVGSVPHPVDEKPTEIPDHSLLLAGTGFAIPDGLPMRTEIPQEYIAKASPSLSIRCRALVTAAPKILVWVEDRTSTINNWDGYPSSLLSSSLSRDIAHQESSATPGDDGDLPTLVPPSATSGGKALPIVTGGDSPVQTPPTRESDGPSNNAGGDSTGPSGGSSNNNELPDIGSEQSDPTDGSSSLNDSSGSGSGASNNGANESSSGTDSESPNDSPSLQSPITIDGIPLTPINSHLVVGNQTLDPGNAITISGKTISLDPSGTAVVVGSSTIPLPVPIITPPPVFTIGGSTVTAASGSVFVVNGQTLTPGGVITINNTPVSFGSSQVVIGSSTQALGTGSISTGGATNTMPGMKGYIIWLILLTLYIT